MDEQPPGDYGVDWIAASSTIYELQHVQMEIRPHTDDLPDDDPCMIDYMVNIGELVGPHVVLNKQTVYGTYKATGGPGDAKCTCRIRFSNGAIITADEYIDVLPN